MPRGLYVRILPLVLALATIGTSVPAFANDANGGAADPSVNDPWEGMNRKVFAFNEKLDIWILRPVAVGWDFVVPDALQTGVRNVFANARTPVDFVNCLLQGKPVQAGKVLGRFLLNTAFGWGGLFDPAREAGLVPANEDFGQTLGVWGVPSGPFLMLPLLGPSSPRGAVGLVADSATLVHPYFITWYIWSAVASVNVVNARAHYIEEIDENRKTALDFYSFQRNAYVSYRENLINDREENSDSTVEGEGLYFFDDDEDEDSDESSGNDD